MRAQGAVSDLVDLCVAMFGASIVNGVDIGEVEIEKCLVTTDAVGDALLIQRGGLYVN